MDNLNTNKFASMTDDELQKTNGGWLGAVAGVVAIYMFIREVVRDKGRADAVRDSQNGR